MTRRTGLRAGLQKSAEGATGRTKKPAETRFLVESLEPRLCLAATMASRPIVSLSGPGQFLERGADATFTVRLSAAPGPDKTVGIHYTTVNAGARAGVQYVAASGDLLFTEQETEKTVIVRTLPNSPNPSGKPDAFSLKLSRPSGLKVMASSASARLVPIRPGITVADVAVPEGDGGTAAAVFEVRLTKPATKTVSVRYATFDDSAATSNGDYVPATGLLTFAPGTTVRTVSVPIVGNATPEPDKTFTLRLFEAKNVPIVKGVATGFILNDDGDPGDASLVSPETVLVGNTGNLADTSTKLGAVPYPYKIGKYEQTVGDYVKFLNAVAKSDPYGLFDSGMAITRTGSPGTYQYAATGSPRLPIEGVTWLNAARFANWMNNGQGLAGTETGAYDIRHGHILSIAGTTAITDGPANIRQGDALILVSKDGEKSYHTVQSVVGSTVKADFTTGQSGFSGWDYTAVPQTHAPNAACWLPTADEWYKAAYYDPSAIAIGLDSGYWRFATRSDTTPTNRLDGSVNRANVVSGAAVAVGSYVGSASYYGTFDQTGNAGEFTETVAASNDADNRKFFADNYVAVHAGTYLAQKPGYSDNLDRRSLSAFSSLLISAGFRLAYSAIGDNANVKPTVTIQSGAASVGNSAIVPIDFSVNLSAPSSKAVLIRYATVDGSAISGTNDYVPQSGYLIFAPGQTQKRVSVNAVGRPGLTGEKTFNLVLSGPVNATLRTAIGIGTIRP